LEVNVSNEGKRVPSREGKKGGERESGVIGIVIARVSGKTSSKKRRNLFLFI
jgi:hypothetical protein